MFLKQIIYRFKRLYFFIKTGLLTGLISEIKYKFPASKLKIIAITGTDGKTMSSVLLYQVLAQSGKKVAHLTNLAADQLQKTIHDLTDQNCEYLILEISADDIFKYRSWGIFPLISGLTNIDLDNFTYHLNYDNYLNIKLEILKKADKIILNKDDESYPTLKNKLRVSESKISAYSLEQSLNNQVKRAIKSKFKEKYNIYNALLVYQIAKELKIKNQDFIESLTNFKGVPGRMEKIENKRALKVIVDLAHTPQSLQAALTALKKSQHQNKKLIAVYGCAGLREMAKRPQMGQIGVSLADLVIFTAQDPRSEDVWSIIRQMKEGLEKDHHKLISIPDRKQAINYALTKYAQKGDIVAILGKGHEQSMAVGTEVIPWDDRVVIREILQ